MGVLVVFFAGGLTLAAAATLALARLPGARPVEGNGALLLDRLGVWLLLSFAVATATNWLLALPRALGVGSLAAAGGLELVAGALLLRRLGAFRARAHVVTLTAAEWAATALALAPVVLWTAFSAWRGSILPPYNHDALAYHYPKAVLMMQAHGFAFFEVPEGRIATWPVDFELLLDDFLVPLRSDHGSVLVATAGYVGLLVYAALVALEWWGRGPHVAVAVALTASAPVVMLHSGLEKHDLLTSFLCLAAFLRAARWVARGCTESAVLATIAIALALGTKLNALFAFVPVAAAVALGAWKHRRELSRRGVALYALSLPVAALLLGAWPYLANLAAVHRLVLPPEVEGGYGNWSAIVQFTYLVLAAPFSGRAASVWSPFHHAWCWWPANDVWFSNFGAAFTVLAVLLVPCALKCRREGRRVERAAASWMALAAYVGTLPIWSKPVVYNASVRYVVFVLPLVAAWTASPLLLSVERRWPRMQLAASIGAAAAAAAIFVAEAIAFGVEDAYAPIEYVAYQVRHPDNRSPWIRRRAATVFDEIAPPNATCAVDVSYDTWVYPAFGEGYSRTVRFLPRTAGPVPIDDDVDWVIVDRPWNATFNNPGFTDMSKSQLIFKGTPTPDDLKVTRQLIDDPGWELVFADRRQNQALFHRRRQ